jgi:multimeric flavodoxin WrbA
MRVLALLASPNQAGNTATLTKKLLEGLTAGGVQEIKEFWLNNLTIQPCQGCFLCRSSGRCIFEDDMQPIYAELEAADLVIFATPIYWWHMAAQMKLCIDRFTALLSDDDKLTALVGKQVVLVVAYNYRDCAKATIGMFEDFKDWINIKLNVLEYCSRQQHVSTCRSKLDKAFTLGQALATNGSAN